MSLGEKGTEDTLTRLERVGDLFPALRLSRYRHIRCLTCPQCSDKKGPAPISIQKNSIKGRMEAKEKKGERKGRQILGKGETAIPG